MVTVPASLRQACDEFNRGKYFECHETLEEVWQEEEGPVRNLYKGLIQLAAAFVHIGRDNYHGADRLLSTAVGYLAPYHEGGAMGFDVARIARQAERAHGEVKRLGLGRLTEFDARLAPQLVFDESVLPAEAQRWDAWGFDRDGRATEMEIVVVQ